MKRIISMLLAVAMVACMLPVFTLATTAAEEKEETVSGLNARFYQLVAKSDVLPYSHDRYYDIVGTTTNRDPWCKFDDTVRFANALPALLRTSKEDKGRAATNLTGLDGIFGADGYLIKWEGTVTAANAGDYTFVGRKIDNGFLAYVDQNGNGIFEDSEVYYDYASPNHWFDGGEDRLISQQGAFHLEAGEATAVQLWYYEADGGEACTINVSTEGGANDKSFADAGLSFNLSRNVYTSNLAVNHNRINELLPAGITADGSVATDHNGCQANNPGNHNYDSTIGKIMDQMFLVEEKIVPNYESASFSGLGYSGFEYEDSLIDYTGYVTPTAGGTYQFGTSKVDNCLMVEIMINGEWVRVYEFWAKFIWNDQNTTYSDTVVTLEEGKSYPIHVTFLEINGGEAVESKIKVNGEEKSMADSGLKFTAPKMKVDGDLSDWEGVKSISISGSGEYEGKGATWHAVLLEHGLYLSCEAYHDVYKTDVYANDGNDWWKNTNLEVFVGTFENPQYWVSARGIDEHNAACDTSANVASAIMVTTELEDGSYHSVAEMFISNAKLPKEDFGPEGTARVGVAWKTEGDKCNNGGNDETGDWWTAPGTKTNYAPATYRCYVDNTGIYTTAEYLKTDIITMGAWTKESGTKYSVKNHQNGNDFFDYYELGQSNEADYVMLSADITIGGQVGFMFGVEDVNGDGRIKEWEDRYYLLDYSGTSINLERNDCRWGDWSKTADPGYASGTTVNLKAEYSKGTVKVYVNNVLLYEYVDNQPFSGTGFGLCAKTNETFDNVTVVEYKTLAPEGDNESALFYQTKAGTVAGTTDYRIIAVIKEASLEDAVKATLAGSFTNGNDTKSFATDMNKAYSEVEAVAANGSTTVYTAEDGSVILGIVITGVPAGYELNVESVVFEILK